MEPMWSPQPIEGYRVWSVRRDRIEGMVTSWRTRQHQATCDNDRVPTAVPHFADRCACGIYATKDAKFVSQQFPGAHRPGVALGKVLLSGRVIEYTNGYRAERAEVTEIVVRTRDGLVHLTNQDDIDALFADPHRTLGGSETKADAPLADVIG